MYFNHAFRKVFLATGAFVESTNKTSELTTVGNFGLYNAATFTNLNGATAAVNFIFASASLTPGQDKIGPFHGGYAETNKSKMINPKYVSRLMYSAPKSSTASSTHIGATAVTEAAPYNCAAPVFNCDQTYYLRIDVKGSPAMRFLNHNVYKTLSHYTGCCDGTTPTAVDAGYVMAGWAKQITGIPSNNFADKDPILSPFIVPVVAVENPSTGVWTYYTKDDTNVVINGQTYTSAGTFDEYVTPAGVAAADVKAGLILGGAYVDTKFGDCSFEPTDFFEKEPILIYASEVDEVGDPCEFSGICVKRGSGVDASDPLAISAGQPALGKQGEGFGETVLRDLILSESYLQNYWNDDPRIREITLGNATINNVDRNGTYGRLYLLHNVPRFNNPSSTFDNDQYLVEIICDESTLSVGGTPAANKTFASANSSDIVTQIEAICASAGNAITLEELK
jgi:hypothetical protein